ncbi:MAG TPA: hypothetical protein PLW83_03040 [Deltaproteobacteria bacterium]|nr:hypothetical protein [Deltaproteobacteria bacterium]
MGRMRVLMTVAMILTAWTSLLACPIDRFDTGRATCASFLDRCIAHSVVYPSSLLETFPVMSSDDNMRTFSACMPVIEDDAYAAPVLAGMAGMDLVQIQREVSRAGRAASLLGMLVVGGLLISLSSVIRSYAKNRSEVMTDRIKAENPLELDGLASASSRP